MKKRTFKVHLSQASAESSLTAEGLPQSLTAWTRNLWVPLPLLLAR